MTKQDCLSVEGRSPAYKIHKYAVYRAAV